MSFWLPGFAISGKAAAGKTTYAEAIISRLRALGADPIRVGFADFLKSELLRRDGMRKEDPGGRQALIWLGAEMRAKDPLVFIRHLSDQYDHHRGMERTVVVDDLRFIDEIEWAEARGLFRVRVESPVRERERRLMMLGLDPDIAVSESLSETALDKELPRFHQWLYNPHPITGVCLSCCAVKTVVGASNVYVAERDEEAA